MEVALPNEFPFDICDDITLKDSFVFDLPPEAS